MLRPKVRMCAFRAAGGVAMLLLALGISTAEASWSAGPPTGWVRLRTTGYRFQTTDELGLTLNRLGAYQEFDGAVTGLAAGRVALRVSGRFGDDLYLKARTTDRSRLYVGQIEVRPTAMLTARLGRQFVQEGPTGLTLDGLWLSVRPDPCWEMRLWGGARAPLGRTFKSGTLGDAGAWGARVATTPWRGVRLAASGAYRERDGRVAARPLGLEGQFTMIPHLPGLRASGRLAYDLVREKWERTDVLAQWRPGAALPVFTAQLVDRRPEIDAASYFARFFDAGRWLHIRRASVRYDWARTGFGAEAEWIGSYVGKRTATRIGGSLILPVGRIGYSARLEDAGEESGWFGEVGYPVLPWVRIEAGAALLTYTLLEDTPESDERDLTSAYARAWVRPIEGVGVVLEVQDLKNPESNHDVRFLAGLDLTAGFGASRFGLERACCAHTSGGSR
jgi:hypothetical protein